jgi:hypothetical protein
MTIEIGKELSALLYGVFIVAVFFLIMHITLKDR